MIIRLKTFSKKKETKEERLTRRDNTQKRDAYAKLTASFATLGGLNGAMSGANAYIEHDIKKHPELAKKFDRELVKDTKKISGAMALASVPFTIYSYKKYKDYENRLKEAEKKKN